MDLVVDHQDMVEAAPAGDSIWAGEAEWAEEMEAITLTI